MKDVKQGMVDNSTAQPCRVGKRKQAGSEDRVEAVGEEWTGSRL